MAGGDELVRVARNKNATLKFLPQNIVPGQYYIYMHLEKKYILHFFQKRTFCRKKKKKDAHIFLILERYVDR